MFRVWRYRGLTKILRFSNSEMVSPSNYFMDFLIISYAIKSTTFSFLLTGQTNSRERMFQFTFSASMKKLLR